MARFSSKMLKDLEESYRSRIVRERDSEEHHFKSEKALLRDAKQSGMIEAMTSAIIASGAESATVTKCTPYISEIFLTVHIKHQKLSESTSEIVEIETSAGSHARLINRCFKTLTIG